MKFGASKCYSQKKIFFVPIILLVLVLAGIVGLSGWTWADRANMTRLRFSNALFCQRVSEAINDSLGDGMADGGDCVNFNLYVSTAEIGNIETLNVVPPDGGFGNIDLESQPISIGGDWTTSFYNLTSLSITNMYVQNISPLESLVGDLDYLDLSGNRIYNVTPLRRFRNNLTYLDLSSNPVGEGMRELSRFTELTTLKLASTGFSRFSELFRPLDVEFEYDSDWNPISVRDAEFNSGLLDKIPLSSDLAKVLQVLDISNNESLSYEKTEEQKTGECGGDLSAFSDYPINSEMDDDWLETRVDLTINKLYANGDDLNSDDLICIAALNNLEELNVSNNHIDDFSSIKNNAYYTLIAGSQIFTRKTESLEYSPLPEIFAQAQQEDYFTTSANTSNTALDLSDFVMDNAQFMGSNVAPRVRFVNAAIAAEHGEDPQPATITIPMGSGVFEGSKLQVYFSGQVVKFNDTNLCNEVYNQGATGYAFIDANGNPTWIPLSDRPIVLMNDCSLTKQIAMVDGGSRRYLRLGLDSINDGANVDLTGLEEFSSLEVLSLDNNALSDIDKISEAYYLQQLSLNNNNLENDDWSTVTDNFRDLRILYLNDNNMSEIPEDLSNLYSLGNLYLVNNGIRDVAPLAHVQSLTVLDLSKNRGINDISGMVQEDSACTPMLLKIEDAGITHLPSSDIIERGFANLTSLNLNGNQITDETIANLASAPKLGELYLDRNQISNTSGFSGITTLTKLYLDNNQIADVSGLSSLVKLAELHLNGNRVSDIVSLNELPLLATLDLKNQTLSGVTIEADKTYDLPAVFSQAIEASFPRVNGFQSTKNYSVINGTIDYDEMKATMDDVVEEMIVTISDGGLAGTTVTVTYGGTVEFGGTLIDNTGGGAVIETTSANSFTVTSDMACMALWTQDDGETWNRLNSNAVAWDNNTREFSMSQANGKKVVVAYVGDVNFDNAINVRDARKIVRVIIGQDSLSGLGAELADVNTDGNINVRDARAIIKSIIGITEISW